MRKLNAFLFTTLNGFFQGSHPGDISWHQHEEDHSNFSAENLQAQNSLLFGRVTYQQMESFWPTEMADRIMPAVAEGMNKAEKYVFSKTLKAADWNNSQIVSDRIEEFVAALKNTDGPNLTILGSGSIVTQLSEAGLIDSYDIMVDPVALGVGATLFSGMKKPLQLKFKNSRVFKNGSILLSYDC